MEKSVLIFSTHPAFAELSRLSLAENKPYIVQTALTIEEMQTLINQSKFDLVILDADYPDENFINLVAAIQEQFSAIKFLVFPPDNLADHPDLKKIRVDTLLLKPFYLPDFLNSVDEIINRDFQDVVGSKELLPTSDTDLENEELKKHSVPDWLDPEKIGNQLNRAMVGSQAQAAFILINDESVAYRGEIEDSAVSDITTHLLQNVDREDKSDIVRFMRLNVDELEHLIYAITFRENGLLVLIFEKTMPLTMARSLISQVEYNLNQMIEGQTIIGENSLNGNFANSRQGTYVEDESSKPLYPDDVSSEEVEMLKVSQLIDQVTNKKREEPDEVSGNEEGQPVSDQPEAHSELPDWLTEPEETAPENSESVPDFEKDDALHWVKEENQQETILNKYENSPASETLLDGLVFPWDRDYEDLESPKKDELIKENDNSDNQLSESQILPEEGTIEVNEEGIEKFEDAGAESGNLTGEETGLPDNTEAQKVSQQEIIQPASIPASEEAIAEVLQEKTVHELKDQELPKSLLEFDSVKAGMSSLNYTCVLVPRFPKHFLVGDVAKRISEWLPQLCISFGWRLERLSVRPQYLQWTVIVDPTLAPSKLIKLIRKETSRRLFKLWPDYELENPSRDFWAPGYFNSKRLFSTFPGSVN